MCRDNASIVKHSSSNTFNRLPNLTKKIDRISSSEAYRVRPISKAAFVEAKKDSEDCVKVLRIFHAFDIFVQIDVIVIIKDSSLCSFTIESASKANKAKTESLIPSIKPLLHF
uniref:Uncharacterized protein n=1 Tax=Glossina austeni TaxID=7395 RepID=A0A1A9UUG8_GLOAU